MKRSKGFFAALSLLLVLVGCTTISQDVVFEAEPILEAPVIVEREVDCDAIASDVDDGIGGTGCRVD